ncbi:uncharacterized protein LOC139919153 [Centroberyx gerrardi]
MEQSFADLLTDAFSEQSLPSFPDEELDFESLYFDEKFEEDKTDSCHENIPIATEEDGALHQEAAGQTRVLSGFETSDTNMAENDDEQETDAKKGEEDFTSARLNVMNVDKSPEGHYESSDGDSTGEGSVSGEDEEVEEEDMGAGKRPGDWLMSVRCGEESWDGDKEDRIFAEGQPLAPEGTENPQVRNEEQGESDSDEDVSYFGRVPQRGSGTMVQGDGIEEEEQQREEERVENSSHTECEGMKIEKDEGKEGNLLANFEFPEISMRHLQDLIADDDTEDVDKMKHFSGDEHQEAGESFADYPSDFSSCEYMEDGGKNQDSKYKLNALPCTSDSGSNTKQSTHQERGVKDVTWMGSAVDTDEKEDQDLDPGGMGIDVDMKMMGLDLATGEIDKRGKTETVKHVLDSAAVKGRDDDDDDDGDETGEPMCLDAKDNTYTEEEEGQNGAIQSMPIFAQYQYTSEANTRVRHLPSDSDTYSSSEDEIQVRRSDDEEYTDNMMCRLDPEHNDLPEDAQLHSESRGNISDDLTVTNYRSRGDPAAFSISWDTATGGFLSEDLFLNPEDADTEETFPSIDIHSVVQLGDDAAIHPSNQGSVDDSFFFNSGYEASRVTELGEFGDDEYEEERNWEQEQERIKAFYKFYDDSEGEDGKEGRKIKVQFCTDPLSQVIHYETDSSDRESLNSSTDGEEDLSSAETYTEPRESETLKMNSALHPPHNLLPENVPDLGNTQKTHTRKQKCLGVLKLLLKLGLVTLMGLLMFWWATDQLDWLDQVAFFKG